MTRKSIFNLAIFLAVLTSIFVSSVFAQAPAVSAATDPANGFPLWYQDANGLRVEPCLDSQDPFCVLLRDAGFNPAQPTVFPSNFPSEFFYYVADSDKLTMPGCPASGIAPGGKGTYRAALEGSFLNGVVQPAQQMTFTRTKIVITGLCPNTTYNVTTPYGVDSVITNAAGAVVANKKGATIDIGCGTAPCDFSIATTSRVFGGFTMFDPAVPPAAPAGYLGDAGPVNATLHTVVGNPGAPATSIFKIADTAGNLIAQTNLFTVSGKIAGPILTSPGAVDFGGVPSGSPSTASTVTITNIYSNAISVTPTIVGTNTADFAISSNTCAGPIARDATCTISVTFTPLAVGLRQATLQIAHDGPFRSPRNVALQGTGTAPNTAPVVSLSAQNLSFGPQRVRTISAPKTVTVTNIGNAPLGANASITGPDSSQFTISNDTCSGVFVAVGNSCSVSVESTPINAGPNFVASLDFNDNAANSPQQVALSGSGTGGLAKVSSTKNFAGFPDWYQDENAVQLVPCQDPADPFCVLAGDPGFDPAQPVVFPSNFPGEAFYYVADTDKMDTPGCPASGTGSTKITYRAALEATFGTANGTAAAGQQIAFTRTKIVVPPGGLCPNTTYAFTHPYGTDLVTTDAQGGIVANKAGATTDIGCAGAPCDFTLPLPSRVMGGFLVWDPAVAPAAPPGHIGDAGPVNATPHAVVGSPYIPPGGTGPANYFEIADPVTGSILQGCKDVNGIVGPCHVSLFTVSGKLAGPISASPKPISFAAESIGTTSAAQTVTFTNGDPAATVNMNGAAIIGANKGSFAIAAGTDTCTGAALAPAATCTIGVTFTPTTTGSLVAALEVSHSGLNTPVDVPLSGIGVTANQPPVAANDSATVAAGSSANIIAVLANDSDPDGNVPLTVGNFTQPSNGTVFLEPDQSMSYNPNAGFSGTDTFTYQAADSLSALSNIATVTVAVTPGNAIPTTTNILAPAVIFPADGVVTVSVSSGTGTPAGNVSLVVDGGAAIVQALVGGSSTFTLPGLALGTHTLAANYAAQGNFATSSAAGSLLVNSSGTTVAINAPPITFNANGLVTVTVSALAGVPTGNVSLSMDGGAALVLPLAAGSATFNLPSPAAGTHTLNATYAAQGGFAASSGLGSLVVSPAPTTITINAPSVIFAANALVTVVVGSAAGTPAGSVSFSIDGKAPISQPLAGGQTTFVVFSPAIGNHTLSASYAAQGNFAASTGSGTLVVNPTTIATAMLITVPKAVFPNGAVSVTVTSSTVTPTGNVNVSVDGGAPVIGVLNAGSAFVLLPNAGVGTHTVVVNYPAQGAFLASSATGSLIVTAAASTTSVNAPTITQGANGVVTVTVSAAGTIPVGTVTLRVDGGAAVGQPLIGGQAIFTINNPAIGSHNLRANFAAQGNFKASTGLGTLVVNPGPEILTVTASATLVQGGTKAQWRISGNTTRAAGNSITVSLTRTGQLLGTRTPGKLGNWTVNINGSLIVPRVGDTITVTTAFGTVATFPIAVQ